MKLKHINNGNCLKCIEIMNSFKPGVHPTLRAWFIELQSRIKDAHISFAGRGRKEQEEFFLKKTSKAHYGESPHNYNAAIDIFRITLNGAEFMPEWYKNFIAPEIAKNTELEWGGSWPKFKDLPHVELKAWKELSKAGTITLVEV